MILEEAIQTITNSLKKDDKVQSVFLKGSIARDEHDEYSDIDIYCLTEEADVESFNKSRLKHLESYGNLLFHDDIYIIAPQILAVYENLLHVDLFTVTEKTYDAKDYIKVLYDPEGKMEKYMKNQNLTLADSEFQDDVDDVAWFLFQYINSSKRGNDIWAVHMLQHVMNHLSRILLHRYRPERAQLGTKTIETSLNKEIVNVL